MKKYILFFCIISMLPFFSSCKKTEVDYFPNGNIKSSINYRFGKEHGKTIYYDENYKVPILTIEMKKGKREGMFYRYYFDGTLETESFFANDLQEGIERTFDKRGFIISETHYQNGTKNGPYISWHDRDVVKERGTYKNDLFDGKWEYYDTRGFLTAEGDYVEGNGLQKVYDAVGNLFKIIQYRQNEKDGDEIYFLPNGDTSKIITYKKGRIENIKDIVNTNNDAN